MTAPPVFGVILDPTRNLVRTRFAGWFDAAAMRAAADKVETLLPELKPGFSIFADFGGVDGMDADCAKPLTRIMDLCLARGVGLIIRILPATEKDIGINLMSIVHYRGKAKTLTVDTAAEAERALG